MTIEPAYSFVLWAIPRFRREGAAKSGRITIDAQGPNRPAVRGAAYAAHDPIPLAHTENPACHKAGGAVRLPVDW